MSRPLHILTALTPFALACLASASTFSFVSQWRTNHSDSFARDPSGHFQDIQEQAAVANERFRADVVTLVDLPLAVAYAHAWQDSRIEPCALIATGGYHADTEMEAGATFSYSVGIDRFHVTFDVDETAEVALFGVISANDAARTTVILQRDGSEIIHQQIEGDALMIDESLTLTPGRYQLLITGLGAAGVNAPGSNISETSFDVQLRACGPADDVTGDGLINLDDLLALLADWGACPGANDSTCIADLENDHHVNVNDLLRLLSEWTG